MAETVTPKVFLVGFSTIDRAGLEAYLRHSGNEAFLEMVEDALAKGLDPGEVLTSTFAKLCYASLSPDKNKNLSGVRDIASNLLGVIDAAHGSVFEHVSVNFIVTDCSRVLTHEIVRHRVGTAFSQTSGRYVRTDTLRFVADPVLRQHGVVTEAEEFELLAILEAYMKRAGRRIELAAADMDTKKRLTSAARRFLPSGQANEIAVTLNLRALRHTIMLRTARAAEWEIRKVFEQIYRLVKDRYPLMFHDALEQEIGGALEVTGMRTQPYERVLTAAAGGRRV